MESLDWLGGLYLCFAFRQVEELITVETRRLLTQVARIYQSRSRILMMVLG